MSRTRSPRKTSLGVLFWIAAILLVALVLMFSLPSIREVLENTGFVEVVFEDRPPRETPAPAPAPQPTPSEEPAPVIPLPTGPASETPATPLPEVPPADSQPEIVITQPPPPAEQPPATQQTTRSTIYLIRVTDDGRIVAESVPRVMSFTTSPLSRAIETLIGGPDADDHNRGLLSLVPGGTQLISARVEDGVAFLNFNDAFRYNTMGLEGYLAQLQQVVLTATAFSSVDAVQILIEGQVVEYLGGDGIYVGRPLRPADFRN